MGRIGWSPQVGAKAENPSCVFLSETGTCGDLWQDWQNRCPLGNVGRGGSAPAVVGPVSLRIPGGAVRVQAHHLALWVRRESSFAVCADFVV